VAGREQGAAGHEQPEAVRRQGAAGREQDAADRDQGAADRDQLAADDEREAGRRGAGEPEARARGTEARRISTAERARSAAERSDVARLRAQHAATRDQAAEARDAAARARDERAAAADREGRGGRSWLLGALLRGRRTAAARARGAAARQAAARDREHAAADREQALRDREETARELAISGIDALTGALLRGPGLVALQREMDRTARSGEPLVVAFVDVDGLKGINDAHGHHAGDEALRTVAHCISDGLRAYDVVIRYGGDEFVCSVAGQDTAGVRRRLDAVTADVALSADGRGISVGLAERRPGEPLEELIERADQAMFDGRRSS
jgi:diguanylate cyclase (GGDEF)-like protein